MKPIKRSLNSIAMSIVELVIGILLLVDPAGFTSGIIVAMGAILMIMGIGSTIKYFRTQPEEAAADQLLVKGMIQLLCGAFCAFNSRWFVATFPVLALVYGVVILLAGLTKLQWTVDMIRTKRERWYLTAISAAISILCGVVIIANPFSTTVVLWMFTGITLTVEAVFDIVGAIFGDREKKAAEPEAEKESE